MNAESRGNNSVDNDEPRIYVACLAAYNAGFLHGEWILANQDSSEIQKEVSNMLLRSPVKDAEEWAIHDYENFAGISINEYTGFDRVSYLGTCISEHGEPFSLYANYVGLEYATKEDFLEAYVGEYSSQEEYAEELFDDCYQIPDFIQSYIDWIRVARDLFCGV